MLNKGLFSLVAFVLLAMTTACGTGVKLSEPAEVIEFRQVLAETSTPVTEVKILGETYSNISCENLPKPASNKVDLITCDRYEKSIYFLGPIEIDGNSIKSSEQLLDEISGEWYVTIYFEDAGTKAFARMSARVTSMTAPMNQIAITQGKLVITAPRINEAITAGVAQITGNFTMEEAEALASAIQNKKLLPESFRGR
jgi:preprotein translocase subunit SecD